MAKMSKNKRHRLRSRGRMHEVPPRQSECGHEEKPRAAKIGGRIGATLFWLIVLFVGFCAILGMIDVFKWVFR